MAKAVLIPADGICPHYGYETDVVCCCDCDYFMRIIEQPELSLCTYAEPKSALRALYDLADAR